MSIDHDKPLINFEKPRWTQGVNSVWTIIWAILKYFFIENVYWKEKIDFPAIDFKSVHVKYTIFCENLSLRPSLWATIPALGATHPGNLRHFNSRVGNNCKRISDSAIPVGDYDANKGLQYIARIV